MLMSDVARGSSAWSASPCSVAEHRGCTPAGKWQLELLCTLACNEPDALRASLRAAAVDIASESIGLGPTLADAPLLVGDPDDFRNHPALAGSKEDAVRHFHANAVPCR